MCRGQILALACCGALAAACGGAIEAQASTVRPAVLPVRAFPVVWIVEHKDPDQRRLVRALAKHLSRRGLSKVVVADRARVARARAAGRAPLGGVVVDASLDIAEGEHYQFGSSPEFVCDALGCVLRRQSHGGDMPVLRAALRIEVTEPAGPRSLQRVYLRASAQGPHYDRLRSELIATLIERAQEATEQVRDAVTIVLLPVDLEDMDEVLVLAQEGRWREARRLAEGLSRTRAAARLEPLERSAFLYDLAQLRRVSREEPSLADLDLARSALRSALSLRASPRYRRALEDLGRHREQMRIVYDQRRAAAANFVIDKDR